MGYAVVKGGEKAMEAAERLIDFFRLRSGGAEFSLDEPENAKPVNAADIEQGLRFSVYKVMAEGGLYAPSLAATAIKQAEGDLTEAAFVMRSYRTSVPRWGYSVTVDTRNMRLLRRISATFRDIPGGQYLGPTRDYTIRLLRRDLENESHEAAQEQIASLLREEGAEQPPMPKVIDILREAGIIEAPAGDPEATPHDVTTQAMRFPNPPRSARLQAMARGESGAMAALAYSSLRGYGHAHPTLAELRVGFVPLTIADEVSGEAVTIGEVLMTECDAVMSGTGLLQAKKNDDGELSFAMGYGAAFGQLENKAISMATLDACISTDEASAPAEDKEFVLYHIDGIESTFFVDHLKLPHYMGFTSAVERLRAAANKAEEK